MNTIRTLDTEEPKQVVPIQCGQIYRIGQHYLILSRTKDGVFLVSLSDGNRWHDPVPCFNHMDVKEDEFAQMCGSYKPFEFHLVEKAIVITPQR